MIKDESVRESIPEQRNHSREPLFVRVLLTLGFTAAQVWAASTLADVELAGRALWALVFVLSAAFMALLDAWGNIWFRAAARRTSRDSGGNGGFPVGK